MPQNQPPPPIPWNRPFQFRGSHTSMLIGLPAGSVWVMATSQNAGRPVMVGWPDGVKLPEVTGVAESTVTCGSRSAADTESVAHPIGPDAAGVDAATAGTAVTSRDVP